jgi:hypothetical protein
MEWSELLSWAAAHYQGIAACVAVGIAGFVAGKRLRPLQ